jgi:hypothetical protein
MSKTGSNTTITTVRDSKSGKFVTVKGAGALKGMMTISKKVDLTKPISVPSPSGKWTPKNGHSGNPLSKSGKTYTSIAKH